MSEQVNSWDKRYSDETFFYGEQPNDFLAAHYHHFVSQGTILCPAEGEGRNAVFLAEQGLRPIGVDTSRVGLAKAQNLAQRRQVTITTEVADLATYVPPTVDGIASIFCHLFSDNRKSIWRTLNNALRPDGVILFEAYSVNQLGRKTGGPRRKDLLYSLDEMSELIPDVTWSLLHEIERPVIEGQGHTGAALVIQGIGRKPASAPD